MNQLRQWNAAVWAAVDWRYIASLAAAGLVAAIIASLISQAGARQDADARARQALEAQTESRQAATRRIDLLQQRIEGLEGDVSFAQSQNAEANTKLDATLEQLRQLGARPVVTRTSSVTTTTRPSTTTTSPSPPPSTTTTTTAPPTPTTTAPPRPCAARPVVGCLPTDP